MPEKQAKTSKTLTPKRKRLVAELANPANTTIAEAGRKAGFAEASIRSTVYSLANSPFISEAVQKRRERAIAHHQVTPEEVLGSAVFQMRSSMDDILDDDGSFSIEKARETGAVDLLKKHKETRKTTFNPDTKQVETTVVVEVELLPNSDGRKEVANYIGLENLPNSNSDDKFKQAYDLALKLIAIDNWAKEKAIYWTVQKFKEIDEKFDGEKLERALSVKN